MKMESAARSGAEMSGEITVNKMGKYSYMNLKKPKKNPNSTTNDKKISCFNCGYQISGSIVKHKKQCAAKNAKCKKCSKMGHFANVCRSNKDIRTMEEEDQLSNNEEDDDNDHENYHINVFRLKTSAVKTKLHSRITNKNDFKVQVVINNSLDTVIADTGARISVCGTIQAEKMVLSTKKIKRENK